MTSLDLIVLLNSDPPVTRNCFVCGTSLKENEQKIVESNTLCTQVPLATKLGDLIGNRFCVIVSKCDEICKSCLVIINKVDKLEFELTLAKNRMLRLLQTNYNIPLTEVDDAEDISDKYDINSEVDASEVDESSTILESQDIVDCEIKDDTYLHIPVDCENDSTLFKCEEVSNDYTSDTVKSEELKCEASTNIKIQEFVINDSLSLVKEESRELLCEYCCSCFFNLEELTKHIEECHRSSEEGEETVLDSGPEIFIESSPLELKEDKVSSFIFKCGVCEFSDPDKNQVVEHLKTLHKVVCEICGEQFNKMAALQAHYASHGKSEGVCVCKICEMPFPNRPVLARHLSVHKRSEGPVTCHVCGKVCHDNLHATHHRRNEHSIIQDLACGLCHQPMESKVELKHHILLKHRGGKKEYKCEECGKTFSRQLQYENHRTYAHGNFHCRVCGKHIQNSVKLRQHEHRHARAESKRFECQTCHKVFKTQSGLRLHSVSHTGDYKYFCAFCGRGFMSSFILEEHKGVHTKEERYVCDVCGRKFVLYSTLHLHKQWHKDPYPFPCKTCGRKFRYRSERSNHVRQDHTGETPYKCEHCDAAFIKLGYLKKHLIVHTKIYPHTCHICKKGYDQKRALAKHYAKVHDDPSLLQSLPKACEYKVALRPEEYPEMEDE